MCDEAHTWRKRNIRFHNFCPQERLERRLLQKSKICASRGRLFCAASNVGCGACVTNAPSACSGAELYKR